MKQIELTFEALLVDKDLERTALNMDADKSNLVGTENDGELAGYTPSVMEASNFIHQAFCEEGKSKDIENIDEVSASENTDKGEPDIESIGLRDKEGGGLEEQYVHLDNLHTFQFALLLFLPAAKAVACDFASIVIERCAKEADLK